jgi:hypothetical protein
MTGNSSVSYTKKERNVIARDLHTTKYRARIVRSRKQYRRKGRVAQWIEQQPSKLWVEGSSPSAITT